MRKIDFTEYMIDRMLPAPHGTPKKSPDALIGATIVAFGVADLDENHLFIDFIPRGSVERMRCVLEFDDTIMEVVYLGTSPNRDESSLSSGASPGLCVVP